jgi:AcrR family transcriptional regulator
MSTGRIRPGPRAIQRDATRARLLRVARQEFAVRGFDGASVLAVCRKARVTHGALYHHFPSKTDLFVAVVEELTNDLAARVEAAVEKTSGWKQVEAACDAYLDACADDAVQAIVFRDGPRVLRERFDTIDQATNEPLVSGLIRRWIEEGLIRPLPVEILARMLGAAIAEAGAAIGASRSTRDDVGKILRGWLRSLRPGTRST